MTLTITFAEPENVTAGGIDRVEYSFPFTIVPFDLQGTPEEKAATENYRIIVSASRLRLAAWHLSDSDLVKILFWFGKCYISDLIAVTGLPDESTIRMPMLSTTNQPDECPFDPAVIPTAFGFTITVDQAKPKIGF